jgi:predicted nucleic-acid-binding Zn-ribbon protein
MKETLSHHELCPECGGERVEVAVNRYMNLLTGGFTPAKLIAWSCTRCGYTSLYVQEADRGRLHNRK